MQYTIPIKRGCSASEFRKLVISTAGGYNGPFCPERRYLPVTLQRYLQSQSAEYAGLWHSTPASFLEVESGEPQSVLGTAVTLEIAGILDTLGVRWFLGGFHSRGDRTSATFQEWL